MTDVNRTTVRSRPLLVRYRAWFYPTRRHGPFPAVVRYGLGAVKVGGLASFAERFCHEGFAAVVIDYASGAARRGSNPATN